MNSPSPKTPKLTAVTFEYRLDGEKHKSTIFLFEPQEMAASAWLNDEEQPFNLKLRDLVTDPHLASGSASIAWDDGVRASLPIPQNGAAPTLRNLGDLVACIADLMSRSGKFTGVPPENNMMLIVAQRAGRLGERGAPPQQ